MGAQPRLNGQVRKGCLRGEPAERPETAQGCAEAAPRCGTDSASRGRWKQTRPPESLNCWITARPLRPPVEQSLDAGGPGKGMAVGEVAPCSWRRSQRKELLAEGLRARSQQQATRPSLKGNSEGAHSVHHLE